MKAVLVIDVPDDFETETAIAIVDVKNEKGEGGAGLCYLKPLPQKESEKHREEIEDWTGLAYSQGWNACLDAITGDADADS